MPRDVCTKREHYLTIVFPFRECVCLYLLPLSLCPSRTFIDVCTRARIHTWVNNDTSLFVYIFKEEKNGSSTRNHRRCEETNERPPTQLNLRDSLVRFLRQVLTFSRSITVGSTIDRDRISTEKANIRWWSMSLCHTAIRRKGMQTNLKRTWWASWIS